MKNFYPDGRVMPKRKGSVEPARSSQAASKDGTMIGRKSMQFPKSVTRFNSYRKRGKAGSPPATTSNPYAVLKRVDWLAIFSPWAIINRSKMYTTSTKQTTCAIRTPANNVALQNFEKTHVDAEPVVSKFFSDEFFAFFFAEKKKVPVRHEDEGDVRRERGSNDQSRFHTPFPSTLHLLLPTIFVSVFICFSGAAKAQSRQDVGTAEAVKPLQIGDTIPEGLWKSELELYHFDGRVENVKLSNYKGKVILLDFWSTTCKSCLEGIPKMERIKSEFGDEVAILLVNSKRSKDTLPRITKTFKRIEAIHGYVPTLPSVLHDTLLTNVFPHNTIPTITWINKEGVFVSNTFGAEATRQNVRQFLDIGTIDEVSSGMFENLDRGPDKLLIDTTGVDYMVAWSGHRKNYLSVYPHLIHKNGTTLFQMGNNGWSFMLQYAFSPEMEGFSWTDIVFDSDIRDEVVGKLMRTSDLQHDCWYQFYIRETIPAEVAMMIFRSDFIKRFRLNIERRKNEIDVYALEWPDDLAQIKSRGGIRYTVLDPKNGEIVYQNVPLSLVIRNLFWAVDRPILTQTIPKVNVDIVFPSTFMSYSLEQRIEFLHGMGIQLLPKKVTKEYPFIYGV